ncbi:MAG: phage tail tape measure protein [Nitrosopumilaceae archaeon]|nr:phage tail tape measure protein [Nitrosopumilaceae archaeon]NIU87784.1 phage tail tape measure protein [Nitrosopumilaceae archaeon]NIV65167.1 phage tail tape measure protein [Nitrosopumilaceae archaeon]NIX61682.1 phage tail tape measure protein [Nitrosopumilaceae archaeon]
MASIQLGTAFVAIRASLTKLNSDLKAAESKIATSMKKTGDRLQSVGKKMTTRLTLPIVGIGTAILKTAGDFEKSMKTVQAISGATGQEFDALKAKARELGSTTQFSASEAADAQRFLAQAGFDVKEILDALPGALNLAAAGQISLGESADIASNILTQFGLEAKEIGRVNDVLAKTATSANVNIQQTAEAMKFVGSTAAQLGLPIEEVSSAIGFLGNAGLQGSIAGTSLNRALLNAIKPSDKARAAMNDLGVQVLDAEGNFVGITDIVKQLEKNLGLTGDTTELLKQKMEEGIEPAEAMEQVLQESGVTADETAKIFTAFGTRGGRALAALLGQGEALEEFTKDLDNAGGTAERIAKKQMEGLNGAVTALKSALQELALAIADSGLLEFATDLVKGLTGIVRELGKTNPAILKWGSVVAGVLGVGGPVLVALGALTKGFASLVAKGGPLLLFVAVATTIVKAWQKWGDDIKDIVTDALTFLEETFGVDLKKIKDIWIRFADSLTALVNGDIVKAINMLVELFGDVVDDIKAVFSTRTLNDLVLVWKEITNEIFNVIKSGFSRVQNFINNTVGKVTGFFSNLKDVLVGNSIIPEIVDLSIREFVRMQKGINENLEKVDAEGILRRKFFQFQTEIPAINRNFERTTKRITKVNKEFDELGFRIDRVKEDFSETVSVMLNGTERMDSSLGSLGKSISGVFAERLISGPVAKVTDEIFEMSEATDVVQRGFRNAFDEAVRGGEGALDVLKDVGEALFSLFAEKFIFDPFSDVIFGFAGSFLGGLIPGFQSGGGIRAGQLGLVGETGPELFVPSVSGTIVPGNQIGGIRLGTEGPNVQVQIFAPPGSTVNQEQTRSNGQEQIRVFIDQATSELVRSPKSRLSQGLRESFGLRRETIPRG